MRIIAGTHRSRILKTLDGDNTRPTQDKVKEAIFSRIGPYFESGAILDLFGGSGAVALEAISRGYDKAVIVDNANGAIEVIKSNIRTLKEESKCEVWKCNYKTALEKCRSENRQFDLIFLDPPYRYELISELVKTIGEYGLLKPGGLIVGESSKNEEVVIEQPFIIDKQVIYGIAKLTYIKEV